MNRKSLISLLLALLLLTALLPASALAEESGEDAAAFPTQTEETAEPAFAEPTVEMSPAEEPSVGEPSGEEPSDEAPSGEEIPAAEDEGERLVFLRFTLEPASERAAVSVFDGEGVEIPPLSDADGVPIPGSYRLAPGIYSYSCQDPDGVYEDLPLRQLTLEDAQERVELTLRLSPRTVETVLAPVVFLCDRIEDFSGLRVTDSNGDPAEAYCDPATGERQYQNYLLQPGEYSYTYHDAGGKLPDQEGRFTVEAGGVQYVTVELPQTAVGLCFSGSRINPCYADVIREDFLPTPSTSPEESLAQLMEDVGAEAESIGEGRSITAVFAADASGTGRAAKSSPVTYDNPTAAGSALKRSLLMRQSEISIRVKCQVQPTQETWWAICGMVYDEAIRHSGVPTEGDYLRYEYGGVRCTGSAVGPDEDGDTYYEFVYAPLYFTTAAQEEELSGRVGEILGGLSLAGKSDEQKIRAVYRYLCDSVGYDYAEDTLIFTAYDALVRGKAACQGVAVAFYRLCLELGLDARVVTSEEMGHAWNIVRADGAHYYALDATWDAGRAPEDWDYYLKGRTSWQSGHSLGDEFLSGSFAAYSFPEEDFEAMNGAIIHSVSVVFDGMLRIKYYFTIPERLLRTRGACVRFSREGQTVASVPLTEGSLEKGYWCCSCGVKAEEIGTPIQARVLDGSGENVQISSTAGTIYPNGFFFSALDYAGQMKTGGSTAAMRALALALEDYGTAAQNYFRQDGGSVRAEVEAVTAADLMPWSVAVEGTKPNGLSEAMLSVLFEADNSLRVYFRFDGSRDPGAYSYTVDGNSALLRRKDDGSCYLCVENIAADELDRAHTISVSDGSDTYTITASALSYAKMSIEHGGRDAANLGRALYLYNRAADAYFGA